MASEDPKILVDGNTSFSGGSDRSRAAYEIAENQYGLGVNVIISEVGDNLRQRPAWHWNALLAETPRAREIFETGRIQGGSWFFDGFEDVLIISIDGYICKLTKFAGRWNLSILNWGTRNNPNMYHVWTCPIPENRLLVSDGQSLPFVIGHNTIRRTVPSNKEIGPARMMVYLQNRLFYVGEFGNNVFASDFRKPLSIKEAIATRIFGWQTPDDSQITALGVQRYANLDEAGGELIYSTLTNVYAVDVRGDRQFWGEADNVGKSRIVIPNLGATGQEAFVAFNANSYFRTPSNGLFGFKQAISQFNNDDETRSGSVEVNEFFDQDSVVLLDKCWMVNYKGRLLTTVQPRLKGNQVYWEGIISMNPDPIYAAQDKLPRRFEGLWTGVQPWLFLHKKDVEEKLWTISKDTDGINRLYSLEEDSFYDVDGFGKLKRIKGVLETRAYAFKSPQVAKRMRHRFYTLDKVYTDLHLKFYSRSSLSGEWTEFCTRTHLLAECGSDPCKPFYSIPYEGRNNQMLGDERETACSSPFEKGGLTFLYRSYRIEFEGALDLSSLLAFAAQDTLQTALPKRELRTARAVKCPFPIYSYKVTDLGDDSTVSESSVTNTETGISTPSGGQGCGCN